MQSFRFADGKFVQRTELNPLDAKYQLRWSSACLLTYNPWLVTLSQLLLLLLLSRFSVSNSVRPQRWQPTRLHRPWDSPDKNTGVDCHFLLQGMKVKSESEVAQSCPTPSNPLQPTRLVRPWDFPGKSTGVGCHCLLRAANGVEQTAGRLFKRKENFKLLTCEQKDKYMISLIYGI